MTKLFSAILKEILAAVSVNGLLLNETEIAAMNLMLANIIRYEAESCCASNSGSSLINVAGGGAGILSNRNN